MIVWGSREGALPMVTVEKRTDCEVTGGQNGHEGLVVQREEKPGNHPGVSLGWPGGTDDRDRASWSQEGTVRAVGGVRGDQTQLSNTILCSSSLDN